MRSPATRILEEYQTLIVKMDLDMTPTVGSKTPTGAARTLTCWQTLKSFYPSLFSFRLLTPSITSLSFHNVKISSFVIFWAQWSFVRLNWHACLWMLRLPSAKQIDFLAYNDLVDLSSRDIPMEWALLPGDSGISHLFLNFEVTRIFALCYDKQIGNLLKRNIIGCMTMYNGNSRSSL